MPRPPVCRSLLPVCLNLIILLAIGLFAAGPLRAQPAPPPGAIATTADPPARVARLADLAGAVSVRSAPDAAWQQANSNWPLAAGSAVWTEPQTSATLDLGGAQILLDGATEVDLDVLDDQGLQASLPRGAVFLHVRQLLPGENFSLVTPRGTVTIAQPGGYEVSAGDAQTPTHVTVVEGSAQVTTTSGETVTVGPHQSAFLAGDNPVRISLGPELDTPFLRFALSRFARRVVALPPAVVAMPGAYALAEIGTWSEVPDYGPVWYPPVAVGWVPYRTGHWAWVPPWGWTWVDQDSWGFAPFHYGRWAHFGNRWGWLPGAAPVSVIAMPVYAPALVAWLAVGASVGWVPLGPQEPFRPWYHASPAYIRRVNITNVRNFTTITNVPAMRPDRFHNAGFATAAPMAAVAAGRPLGALARPVSRQNIVGARAVAQPPGRPQIQQRPAPAPRPAAHPLPMPRRPAIRTAPGPTPRAPLPAARPGPAPRPTGPTQSAPAGRVAPRPTPTLRPPAQQAPAQRFAPQQHAPRPAPTQRPPAQQAPAQRFAPQQQAPRTAPIQRPPAQQAPAQRFAPQQQAPRPAPIQRPPVQQAPVQRFAPQQQAPRPAPIQRPPVQQAPVQRFAPQQQAPRPAPIQRPPVQRAPVQHFAPQQQAPRPAPAPQQRQQPQRRDCRPGQPGC